MMIPGLQATMTKSFVQSLRTVAFHKNPRFVAILLSNFFWSSRNCEKFGIVIARWIALNDDISLL